MSNKKENIGYSGNVEMQVKNKDGKIKKLWKENFIGKFIRSNFGSYGLCLQGIFLLGSWVDVLKFKNTTTNTGFAAMASRCNGSGAEDAFTYLATGTGTTSSAAGDTALEAEITTGGLDRALATLSRTTTTQTNDTARLLHIFTSSASHAITELGTFNDASAGIMLGHQVFSVVNIVSGDTISLSHSFKFS